MYHKPTAEHQRIRYVAVFFLILAGWIVVRLFVLQIVQHKYYALFALNAHEIYRKLHPERGQVFFQDTRTKQEYPAAVNKEFYIVYAVPKEMPPSEVATTTAQIIRILDIQDEDQKKGLEQKFAKTDSVYAPVAKKIPEEKVIALREAKLKGIYITPQTYRYYPEERLAASVLGFTGSDNDGNMVGRYGIEGYWEKELVGKGGLLAGERGALGSWIATAGRTTIAPENGVDLLLTIDRALEYKACERLREGLVEYKAKSAALVLMDPMTGAVLAMCSLPDFDPNNYSKVKDIAAFNNTSIFTSYEPGSVFKPITMAAGLDLGLVSPTTVFTDPCDIVINGYHVRNAERKCYGEQTMTQVLEKSINTGMVWVEERVGGDRFREYAQKFGFGNKTGVNLNTEAAGDISSLDKKGQIFGANGSFGQGLTATPLQLAAAYAAIANEGKLPKPYIVEEVRYANGKKERTLPSVAEQVVSPRAAKLLSGMLVSVVENHYHAAKIKNYYVAGKTGTAQIAERGAYSIDRTNHTFAGFAPADHPRFVLIVKYEEPEQHWAEQTALPVFRDVMKFALDYYGVAGKR